MMTKKRNIIITVLFFTVLWIPMIGNLFHLDPTTPLDEFRILSTWSNVKTAWRNKSNCIKEFEAFFNDNLGFRRFLLQARGRFLVQLMGTTANREKVILGKNLWMFNNKMYYTDINPLPYEHFENYKRVIDEDREWLKKKGIDYYIIIVPAKGSIYPEYLPDCLDFYSKNIKQNQFTAFFRKYPNLNLIEFKNLFKEKKKLFQLYYNMDHHWNDIGAFFAYQEVVRRVEEQYPSVGSSIQFKDIKITNDLVWSPGFARMSGLKNVLKVKKVGVVIEKPMAAKFAELHAPDSYIKTFGGQKEKWTSPILAVEQKNESLPSMVMIHNSFGNFLRPFLSEHFRRSFFCVKRKYLNIYETAAEIIEREKPDMVIQQIWEVHLQFNPDIVVELRPKRNK